MVKIMRNHTAIAILTFVAATLITSAAGAGQFGDYEPQGFLSDYSRLKPMAGDKDAFAYKNPEAVAKYDKLMIDRIKIYLKADAKSKEIDPTQLKELADYFHQAIVKAVGDAYPVVEAPGPDVLRLRIAITDLVPNKPEASVVSLVVPFLWVGEAGAGAAEGKTGSTPFVGEASVELEGLDSETHKQIVAFLDTQLAKKFDVDLTEGVGKAVEKGASGYFNAYSTWAYTKAAMDHWAQLIRQRLDAAHGK